MPPTIRIEQVELRFSVSMPAKPHAQPNLPDFLGAHFFARARTSYRARCKGWFELEHAWGEGKIPELTTIEFNEPWLIELTWADRNLATSSLRNLISNPLSHVAKTCMLVNYPKFKLVQTVGKKEAWDFRLALHLPVFGWCYFRSLVNRPFWNMGFV